MKPLYKIVPITDILFPKVQTVWIYSQSHIFVFVLQA